MRKKNIKRRYFGPVLVLAMIGFTALTVWAGLAMAQDMRVGRESGRPLPRFEATKSSEINLRIGPSLQYPVFKVIRRSGLPVLVEEETADAWRQILVPMDSAGLRYERGWVAGHLLQDRAMGMVMHDDVVPLLLEPDEGSMVIARLEPGVIGRIKSCDAEWCRIGIDRDTYVGWIPRIRLWGVR